MDFSLQQTKLFMNLSLNCPIDLCDIDIIKNMMNPQTPNFGQFTFMDTKESTREKTCKTQESNLLEDEPFMIIRQPSPNDKKSPFQSKKSLEVTTAWNKEELLNSLLLQRNNLISKLDKSEQDKRNLASKLELKSRELESVKLELVTLKQNMLPLTPVIPRMSSHRQQVKYTPYPKQIPKPTAFHSKRSISEIPRHESNYSSKENQETEKLFKDRLERVCRRLQVLQEEQQMIRFKSKLSNTIIR